MFAFAGWLFPTWYVVVRISMFDVGLLEKRLTNGECGWVPCGVIAACRMDYYVHNQMSCCIWGSMFFLFSLAIPCGLDRWWNATIPGHGQVGHARNSILHSSGGRCRTARILFSRLVSDDYGFIRINTYAAECNTICWQTARPPHQLPFHMAYIMVMERPSNKCTTKFCRYSPFGCTSSAFIKHIPCPWLPHGYILRKKHEKKLAYSTHAMHERDPAVNVLSIGHIVLFLMMRLLPRFDT